jgi:regulatory protein
MPIITSIKPQKNFAVKPGGKRVNVYLDGKFGFGIDLENFVKLDLKVEQVLSEDEVKTIIQKLDFQKISDKLINFATIRPRSEKEIELWLLRKKVQKNYHRDLWDKLRRLELIGDEKFAKWWIGQRLAFRFKSKRELEQELRIKGIKREVVDRILGESNLNDEAMAKSLLAQKAYKWNSLPKQEARQKMTEFLSRKGFGWEVIKKVIA